MNSTGNWFLALTPYNVFLATTVALSKACERNHLWLFSDFQDARLLHSTIRSWPHSPFQDVRLLKGLRPTQPLPLRVLQVSRNAHRVAKWAQQMRYAQIYTFNERRPESQAAMYQAKRNRSLVTVIEDGLNAYREKPFPVFGARYAHWVRKSVYGRWFEDIRHFGGCSYTDAVLAICPEIAPRENNSKYRQLQCPPETERGLTDLAERYFHALNISPRTLQELDAVLFLTHSGTACQQPHYADTMYRVAQVAASNGLRLGLKYHPREHLSDPFQIEKCPGVIALPRGAASEFLLLHPAVKLRCVLGDTTSVLLTTRWLRPAIPAVSLCRLLQKTDQTMLAKFRRAGILEIDDPGDLMTVLVRQTNTRT